ncbi:MAG: hypothetical protein QM765_17410 [Myxococcales bacterium]
MSSPVQRFSHSGLVNEWFEDEAAEAAAFLAARRRRWLQAMAGIVLSLALVAGFGAMAYLAVGYATKDGHVAAERIVSSH